MFLMQSDNVLNFFTCFRAFLAYFFALNFELNNLLLEGLVRAKSAGWSYPGHVTGEAGVRDNTTVQCRLI